MESAVLAAMIAAVASMIGAAASFLSAKRASNASVLNSNRALSVLDFDRASQDLRRDYVDFLNAVVTRKGNDYAAFALGEVLRVNPLCTQGLESAVIDVLTAIRGGGVSHEESSRTFERLRQEVRAIFCARAVERQRELN